MTIDPKEVCLCRRPFKSIWDPIMHSLLSFFLGDGGGGSGSVLRYDSSEAGSTQWALCPGDADRCVMLLCCFPSLPLTVASASLIPHFLRASGTGKTVALLSLILAYQHANGDAGKLVYCTRTVQEMDKVVEELKRVMEYRQRGRSGHSLPSGGILDPVKIHAIPNFLAVSFSSSSSRPGRGGRGEWGASCCRRSSDPR